MAKSFRVELVVQAADNTDAKYIHTAIRRCLKTFTIDEMDVELVTPETYAPQDLKSVLHEAEVTALELWPSDIDGSVAVEGPKERCRRAYVFAAFMMSASKEQIEAVLSWIDYDHTFDDLRAAMREALGEWS